MKILRGVGGNAPIAWRAALLSLVATGIMSSPAWTLDIAVVSPDQDRQEITSLVDTYTRTGDRLRIDVAPSADGIIQRMEVRAREEGSYPTWIVFALRNPTDQPIERWLSIEGDGAARVRSLIPSRGFRPERRRGSQFDSFQLTLEPRETITFVAELSHGNPPRLFLSKAPQPN